MTKSKIKKVKPKQDLEDPVEPTVVSAVIPFAPDARHFELMLRLNKDLKKAALSLGKDEARFLVDAYYMIQEVRKRLGNQCNMLTKSEEPHDLLATLLTQTEILETNIAKALDIYSDNQPIGQRMRKVHGVGPVIAAGLIAHIDMDIATHAGKIFRFAGLDPTIVWEKGQKRPYNAALKTLCWKVGQSFMKFSGSEKCFYGHIYRAAKAELEQKNEAGMFAETAKAKLEKFKIGKTTDAYKAYSQGKLPPAHLDARARRKAVVLFLSHLHENWLQELGKPKVRPWVIEHGGHVDYIAPNW